MRRAGGATRISASARRAPTRFAPRSAASTRRALERGRDAGRGGAGVLLAVDDFPQPADAVGRDRTRAPAVGAGGASDVGLTDIPITRQRPERHLVDPASRENRDVR